MCCVTDHGHELKYGAGSMDKDTFSVNCKIIFQPFDLQNGGASKVGVLPFEWFVENNRNIFRLEPMG